MKTSQKQYKVYRNLHNGLFSIQDKDTGLVVGHAESVSMIDCEFKVNESGRQRVLKEKRKNVHAFVIGGIVNTIGFQSYKNREVIYKENFNFNKKVDTNNPLSVIYNPYRYEQFFCLDKQEYVYKSDFVWISNLGIIMYSTN